MGAARRSASRGNARGAPGSVGARARRAGLGGDDEPGDPSLGVDLQAKTVGATQRDDEARTPLGAREGSAPPRPEQACLRGRVRHEHGALARRCARALRARAPKGERAYYTGRRRGTAARTRCSWRAWGSAVWGSPAWPSRAARPQQRCSRRTSSSGSWPPHSRPGMWWCSTTSPPIRAIGYASSSKKGERSSAVLALLLSGLLLAHRGGVQQVLKALLRREKARTKEALLEAIGRALDAITPEDAKGWFGHCGYVVAQSL